jgi:hypothetical protein
MMIYFLRQPLNVRNTSVLILPETQTEQNMYEIILKSHNGLRWIMLALLLFVIARSWNAFAGKKSYGKLDNATGGALVGVAHLQLLLGLILYFGLSPWTQQAFTDFGEAMKDPKLRFYAVEHILTMIIAVGLIQAGRIVSKKATNDAQKFRKMAIFTTGALILIISRMPHWKF